MASTFEETRNLVCTRCDGVCPIAVKIRDGCVVKVTTPDHPLSKDVICGRCCGAWASLRRPTTERRLRPRSSIP